MIAVIPLGPKRPDTLRYVARALEAHTEVTGLVTVGERPTINSDLHIDSPNDQSAAHLNVLQHLTAALDRITTTHFVWLADDIIPLKPWTPGVYVRRESIAAHLKRYANKGRYAQAIRASIDIIRHRGFNPDEVPCGSIHRPWYVETDRVRETVKLVAEKGDGEWKAVYVAGLADPIPAGDPKIVGGRLIASDADMVSLFATSWRSNAGRHVRETFTTPSRWE